ncbi:MAG: hypothetical protein L3J74_08845 [Bacteroidales bacterium]|nr:hypothetical protein [Bacteroidales bacterium]
MKGNFRLIDANSEYPWWNNLPAKEEIEASKNQKKQNDNNQDKSLWTKIP